MDSMEIVVQQRDEGEVVRDGVSFTEGLQRVHVVYQKKMGDKTYRVHFAIPYKTACDPTTWYVDEEEHESTNS
jgi:hypothetical protein